MFSQMVTKSKDCSDIHELCLSQAEFERREKNKQAIYGGAILNRRVRADNMKCYLLPAPGGGGTPIYGLYRYVPQNRVWVLRFSFLK